MSKIEKLINEKTKANNEISKLNGFLEMPTSLKVQKRDPKYSSPNFLWLDEEDKEELDDVIIAYIKELIEKKKSDVKEIESLLKKLEEYL